MLSGQAVFRHFNTLQGLAIDDNGRLLVGDSEAQTYQLVDKNLRATNKLKPRIPKPSAYSIWKGQLREEVQDGFHLYTSDGLISDVVVYGEQRIVAGEVGLQLFKEGKFKTFHIPGITFPKALIKLALGGDKLAMLDRQGDLYVFDLKEQILKSVTTDVNHFIWDKWNTLWYTQGRALGFNIDYVNKEPPVLIITSLEDGHGNELESPISLEPEDELIINFISSYPPMLDEPDLVYRLRADDDWQKIVADSRLKLKNLPEGLNEIQLKVEGIEGVTAFSDNLSVRVESDWWAIIWPTLAGVLSLLLALVLMSYNRQKNQMNKLKEEKEKTLLKVALQDKQQKIGQLQMNPHFLFNTCLLYTSPSPRDQRGSRMPSSA